jgi:hypothetical protein
MATAAEVSGRPRKGSGFISPDNNDPTAKALSAMRDEEELSPQDCLHCNVISWYIGTATTIRAPGIRDIREATPHLHELLGLLTRLQVVVLMGRKGAEGLGRGRAEWSAADRGRHRVASSQPACP